MSAKNVNVARFAGNVEWDFFLWFSNTVDLVLSMYRRDLYTLILFMFNEIVHLTTIWAILTIKNIFQKCTVFENHRKVLSTLQVKRVRRTFWVDEKCQKWSVFEKLKHKVKQCYQTYNGTKISSKSETFPCIFQSWLPKYAKFNFFAFSSFYFSVLFEKLAKSFFNSKVD